MVTGVLFIGLAMTLDAASKEKVWQDGVLTDIERANGDGKSPRYDGSLADTLARNEVRFIYTVEVGDKFYVGSWTAHMFSSTPIDVDTGRG